LGQWESWRTYYDTDALQRGRRATQTNHYHSPRRIFIYILLYIPVSLRVAGNIYFIVYQYLYTVYLLKVNIYIQNFVYRLSEPRNTHTHSTSYSPPSIILYIHSSIISPPSTISTPTFYIPIFYDSFSLRSLSLPHLGNSHIYVTLHSKTSILCDHLIKFRLRHSA